VIQLIKKIQNQNTQIQRR